MISPHDDTEVTRVHRSLPKFCLRGVSGPTFGKVLPLRPRTLVGRQDDCHLILQDEGVSRQHAVLEVSGDTVKVKDLNASNGTFVNGRRVRSAQLRPGDEIAFDNVRFRFEEVGGGRTAGSLEPASHPAAPACAPAVRSGLSARRVSVALGLLLALAAILILL